MHGLITNLGIFVLGVRYFSRMFKVVLLCTGTDLFDSLGEYMQFWVCEQNGESSAHDDT